MSIMDFFRGGNNQQPQGQQQAAAAPAQGQAPNQSGQPNGQMPGTNQEPVNPLDAYAKMWAPIENQNQEVAPSFNLDPKVLSDVSSKLNFAQDIPPEVMQAAAGGDANAMAQMMNMIGQNAYKAALSHTSSLTDKFVGARTEHAMKGLGGKVKSELTQTALSQTPNYKHPAVKQQLDMVAQQYAAQHPDATPDQVAQMSIKYITDLANALNPQSTKQEEAAAGEVDWAKYFSS